MSDTAVETKETQAVPTTPEKKEKEVVCERKPKETPEKKEETKTEDKPETNGHSKTDEKEETKTEKKEEKKTVENGDSTDLCSLPQKRKSEVGSGDAAEKTSDGATPEKKAKLEEKVENGEAETKA